MKTQFEKVRLPENSSILAYQIHGDYFAAPLHYHPEYEITLIQEGKGIRFIGDHTQVYHTNDLVGLASGIPHHWRSDRKHPGSRAIVIQFSKENFGNSFWKLPEIQNIEALLHDMKHGLKFECHGPAIDKIISLPQTDGIQRMMLFIEILADLDRLDKQKLVSSGYYNNLNLPNKSRLEKIYDYVYKNFKNDFRLEDISAEIGLTRESFSRYFKKHTSGTFIEYLNNHRIAYASKLLRETNLTIIEIAYESGYHNLSNFNRQFKRLKKMSPREYRKWI